MIDQQSILYKLQLLERIKAELITHVGQFFTALAVHQEQRMKESLAAIILTCYILGRRLGIDFLQLDETVFMLTGNTIKQDTTAEKVFGDYSEYLRYLRQKR